MTISVSVPERRERCPKSRFSVNIILTDPEPFSECLRDPEKSYRTLTGNLTEIDKIIWKIGILLMKPPYS